MNVFALRDQLIADYSSYISSFIHIRNARIRAKVDQELKRGLLWPDPLIQLNPAFAPGKLIDELVEEGLLHQECGKIFRKDKDKSGLGDSGTPLRLHRHQEEAIRTARSGENYVLTTGTGSGKSMTYIVPIVDHVLRRGTSKVYARGSSCGMARPDALVSRRGSADPPAGGPCNFLLL